MTAKPDTSHSPTLTAVANTPAQDSWSIVPAGTWLQITIIAVLFACLHTNILGTIIRIAKSDPDWSHAFLVPFFSLYFIHTRRQAILATRPVIYWPGLIVFLAGLIGHLLSIFPVRSIIAQGYTMILEIIGIVMFLLGPRLLRLTWFPICYLVFAIKFSSRLWNLVAWQLQTLAAKSAVVILNLLGIEAEVSGSTIDLWRGTDFLGGLNVAEACSGLRMLIAFMALGVAIIYLVKRPWWARTTMLLLTVPIAVAVNVLRVTITGILHLVNPELSVGDFHILIGMLMVLPAVAVFLLLGWLLDHIVIHEDDDHSDTRED